MCHVKITKTRPADRSWLGLKVDAKGIKYACMNGNSTDETKGLRGKKHSIILLYSGFY